MGAPDGPFGGPGRHIPAAARLGGEGRPGAGRDALGPGHGTAGRARIAPGAARRHATAPGRDAARTPGPGRRQARSRFTASLMALPSARPASSFEATPITLPISLTLWAPVRAMMSFTAASISAAERGCGR